MLGFGSCLRACIPSVRYLATECSFSVGDRGGEREIRSLSDDHQINITTRICFPFHEGPVHEGKLDLFHRPEGLKEYGAHRGGLQNKALEILVKRMFAVQSVAYLVPRPLGLEETDGLQPPQVSQQVARRFAEESLKFTDVKRLARMEDKVRQQFRPRG